MNVPAELKVSIKDRKTTLFDGAARSLTSFNDLGIFDVLPKHANFVTLISRQIILNKGTPEEQSFDIDKALMSVDADKIDVYVGL